MTSAKPPEGSPSRKRKPKVRTHTPRPDELSQEVFEFIAAVDDYKRRNMRSFLEYTEILEILFDLGYVRDGRARKVTEDQLADFARMRERYRVQKGRLFPTWSEVFELLSQLGYSRRSDDTAA
jgi:hypothetical protein